LTGGQKDDVVEMVRKFKYEFKERPGWEKVHPSV
jgi:hypothetical protein